MNRVCSTYTFTVPLKIVVAVGILRHRTVHEEVRGEKNSDDTNDADKQGGGNDGGRAQMLAVNGNLHRVLIGLRFFLLVGDLVSNESVGAGARNVMLHFHLAVNAVRADGCELVGTVGDRGRTELKN